MASGVGMAALARAAAFCPVAVLSCSSSASICLLPGAAAGHEGGDQLPAQVLVHGQALQRQAALQQAGDRVQLPGAAGQQGVGLDELQLRVGAGRDAGGELPEPVGGGHRGGFLVFRGHVEVQRGGELAQLDQDHGGIGFLGDVGQDQFHVAAGRGLAVAGRVPGRAPHERAGKALAEVLEVRRGGGEGLRVEADLGVGEVVVVEQDQVRLGQAGQRRHLGALAVDVELLAVDALQLPGAVEVVEADGEAVRAERRAGPRWRTAGSRRR